jgi:quinoprotein glucose dehydrogenase
MKKLFVFFLLLVAGCTTSDDVNYDDWQVYLGDFASSQYSGLDEINAENVSNLKLAWSYSSNDKHEGNRSQIQCNPLIIDGILYGTSATLKLFALDAETGEELWTFDPFDDEFRSFGMGVNRGLMFYENADKKRIFYSASHFLYSVNITDGTLDKDFGEQGKLDMKKGLGRDVDELFLNSNSPGVIFKDLVIMGSRVSESTGAAPGHIRAFDVHTGEQKWMFKTIPHPGEKGYDSWPKEAYLNSGGANVWAGFSLDKERGIVYCPTGSASFDFYGGDRHGDNLFANCILALDANTGNYKWHFQTIHHDVWDKDLPAPPNLMTIKKDGKSIDVVAQITKNGLLYVLNRETGDPLFPIEEIEVPQSDLRGERTSSTQPLPSGFPRYARTTLTKDDLADRNEDAKKYAETIWNESKPYDLYQPPSEEGTIIFPGFDGGGEWGGAAHDPKKAMIYINSSEMPWRTKMLEVKPETRGEGLYNVYCSSCHGAHFEGGELFGNVPSLVNLKDRLSEKESTTVIKQGKGVMPSFAFIDDDGAKAIYNYINGLEKDDKMVDSNWPYPYRMRGYEKLYAPDGYPMIKPPWGQLTAIDMNKREIAWQITLGEYKDLTNKGMAKTGTENYGGPVVTAGNVLFIAATSDEMIRAFDSRTGQELWSLELPAAGYATPATYSVNGKQYVVIACGGGKLNTKSGDTYLAFSL